MCKERGGIAPFIFLVSLLSFSTIMNPGAPVVAFAAERKLLLQKVHPFRVGSYKPNDDIKIRTNQKNGSQRTPPPPPTINPPQQPQVYVFVPWQMAIPWFLVETNQNQAKDNSWVSRSSSDSPPNHFILKLQLFSQLEKNKIESYISADFEAGGYKWRLVLHPNGNKNKGITDHLSLYLSIAESNSLGTCWEVHAVFRLFLLDKNKDCYLTLQDTTENGRRFHRMKLEWGFDKFIPITALKDTAKGYLVDDTCVFGAEVYVCREKLTGKGECLSMIKDAITYKYTWRVVDFSSIYKPGVAESNTFNAADHKWKIQLYPMGKGSVSSYMSAYLTLAEPKNLPPTSKIYAEFTLRILDQLDSNHYFITDNYWFSASNSTSGWPRFISRDYLIQSIPSLVPKYTYIMEAEIKVHAVVNSL